MVASVAGRTLTNVDAMKMLLTMYRKSSWCDNTEVDSVAWRHEYSSAQKQSEESVLGNDQLRMEEYHGSASVKVKMRVLLILSLMCFFVGGLESAVAWAGASPCQWVIVVNGASDRSRTIANHYAHWRNIPPQNIVVLSDVPQGFEISFEDYKTKIFEPLFAEIGRRRLEVHIQGIAYSSDFPNGVNLGSESVPEGEIGRYMLPVASLNGLTYLYRFVREFGHVVELNNNWYAGREPKRLFEAPNGDNESQVQKDKRRFWEEKRYTSVLSILEEEMAKYPGQYPMAYEAAQASAEAGQLRKAIELLQRAIESGWTYGPYLMNDEHLKGLHEFNRFQTLVRGCEDDPFDWTPAVSFDARRFYSPNGVSTLKANKGGVSGLTYMLSMSLAACGGPSGNSEKEVLKQLKTSIDADFTHPDGEFYFTLTDDVRTRCRESGFDIAKKKLEQLGRKGEIVDTPMPMGKPKCLGVTMGMSDFSWVASRSTLVPGALGDNLTSWGGVMESINQTKISEFLRHGAAAASGTVAEPYSIQAKFPHPTVHAYYAAGLTAAEAFYSSIAGPYQLLIAGDPLCQPFAKPPLFEIESPTHGQQIGEGIVVNIAFPVKAQSVKPQLLAILVDGQVKGVQALPQGVGGTQRLSFPGKSFSTGAHELRFVGIDNTRIGTRYEQSVWLLAGEEYNQIKLSGPTTWKSSDPKPLTVEIIGTESDASIEIVHDSEWVASLEPGKSKCEIPTKNLGRGPVRLQAVAKIGANVVASLPITVMID